MRRTAFPRLTLAALLVSACAHGQSGTDPSPAVAPAGEGVTGKAASSAFCLFEVPGSGGARKFVNLGIVQYVELAADEVRLYYGGGNLGSGHEARLPLKSRDEGPALIARMQKAAQECK
jgi:hypothetical protein